MKICTLSSACVSIALTSLCVPVSAQSSDSSNIERISIVASRSPILASQVAGKLDIINREQILASGAVNITDLLRTVAGMNISQNGPDGSLAELRFRGSESNHTLVLVDGVPANDLAQGGLVNLAHFPVANIARIEILRGPQSALWGSDAVAGVISITTLGADLQSTVSANLQASIGEQHNRTVAANLVLPHSQQSQSMLGFSYQQNDGSNVSRLGDEAEGYRNLSVNAKQIYNFADSRISATINVTDYFNEFDGVDFVSTGLPTDTDDYSLGQNISGSIEWSNEGEGLWSQSLSYQFAQQANTNVSDQIESGRSKGTTHKMVWQNHFAFSAQEQLNIGLEGSKADFEQRGPVNFGDPNQDQSNQGLALFADARYQVQSWLSANASLRRDASTQFDDATSYRIGAVASVMPSLDVYVSHGKAIKNPSFTERFGYFPRSFVGNPDLAPEHARSKEIGIRYQASAHYHFDLALFDTTLEDEINGFVYVPELGSFTAQNSDLLSTRKGAELSLQGSNNKLNWQVNYAYLDAKDALERELRRARHSFSLALDYAISERSQIYVQASYDGERSDRFFPPFPANPELVTLSSYYLVNANYRYNFDEDWTLSVKAHNLLDKHYENVLGFKAQPRRISVALNYQY